MVLDMPDSILTSVDLKSHQKHPTQAKNVPPQKKYKTGLLYRDPYIGEALCVSVFNVFLVLVVLVVERLTERTVGWS